LSVLQISEINNEIEKAKQFKPALTEIAKRLPKHRTTLYRELERNKEIEGYSAGIAQLKTEERAKQKRLGKIEKDGYLRDYIVRSLKKGWSPEQISGRMKFHKLTIYVSVINHNLIIIRILLVKI
jgi:IS30 family transposase